MSSDPMQCNSTPQNPGTTRTARRSPSFPFHANPSSRSRSQPIVEPNKHGAQRAQPAKDVASALRSAPDSVWQCSRYAFRPQYIVHWDRFRVLANSVTTFHESLLSPRLNPRLVSRTAVRNAKRAVRPETAGSAAELQR